MSGTHRMISNEQTLRHMRTTTIACTFAAIAACGLSACKNPDRSDRYQASDSMTMKAPTPAPVPVARTPEEPSKVVDSSESSPTDRIISMADLSLIHISEPTRPY